MKTQLVIECFFDLICPWCLIGKRHLGVAIAQLAEQQPEVEVEVVWRSQTLLPDVPVRGLDYQQFYVQRLGSHEAVAARRAQVREAGLAAGIAFAFEDITLMPSTLAAHRLLDFAREYGSNAQLEALIDQLFVAYFVEAKDIGDPEFLMKLGAAQGFYRTEIAHYLNTAPVITRHGRSQALIPERRVNSVPGFVFNQQFTLSGALPPSTLLAAMQQALR